MATYIFPDSDTFKGHIGKGISANMTITEMDPIILAASEKYLIPWLGYAFWDKLVEDVEDDAVAGEYAIILPYVQRTLAWFTMHEYPNVGEVNVSDRGIMRMETEDHKTAYKSQVNNYTRYARETAYAALETMLRKLETFDPAISEWSASDESLRNREAFINSALDFQLAYSTKISRYVMETTRGVMLDIEEFAILPLIGQPFFEELKTAILAKTETAEQLTIIKMIRKAVAAFTVEEGIRRSIVLNTGEAIVVIEALEPQSNYREGAPDAAKLRMALRHNDEWGNRHISLIKNYLANNIEDYPTYQTWVEEIAAAAAAAEEEAAAITSTCYDGCSCNTCLTTSSSTKITSVVRI
jgi:hypothetical protein